MLSRWQIKDSPTAKDPKRRLLYVKGNWNDVHGLVRRLGPVCGRPKKESTDPEYNYSIVLHKLEESQRAEVEAVLKAQTGGAPAGRTPKPSVAQATPPPVKKPEPAPPPAQPQSVTPIMTPMPTRMPEPPPGQPASPFAGFGAVPSPDAQAKAPPAPSPSDPTNPFAGFGGQSLPFKRSTAHEPLSPPFEAPPPGAKQPLADLMAAPRTPDPVPLEDNEVTATGPGGITLKVTPPAPGKPPAEPPKAKAPEAVPPPPSPKTEPVVPAGTTSIPRAPKGSGNLPPSAAEPLFGAVRGLDPERTLDNLVVGSYNRFAHAAAMSLLTSPGSLYNPLVVWGGAGTGKTHLVNALGLRLQEQNPHETVWLTSGSVLARAAGLAQAAGRAKELIDFAAKSRALVIDDFHMTGVADHNADTLMKLVAAFLGAGKQVVVSSLYPPKHIGPLEQAVGLRSEKGHAVELKVPNDAAQQAIGEAALARLGLSPSNEERDLFARGVVKDFSLLDDHLRRLGALAALSPGGTPLGQFLREVFAPDSEAEALSPEQMAALKPAVPAGGKTPLVVLHPPGAEPHADMLASQVHQAARGRGWSFPWAVTGRRAYPLDPPHAAPYLLAEECLRAGAQAALIVGPPPGSDLAGQERLFRITAARLLAEAGVPSAAVPFARVRDSKQAVFAYLDLSRGGRA